MQSSSEEFTLKKLFIYSTLIATIVIAGGCSHKPIKPTDQTGAPLNMDASDGGSSDQGNAMGLKTVHFEYDSSLLPESAKRLLEANAAILKDHPNMHIQIEGNCDQKGGIQYNLALGERRAKSARDFLLDAGIGSDRITIVSFGKEHLLSTGETEADYAKNRRDNFVITRK